MEVAGGLVADTPGFSSLDFDHIEKEELRDNFVEMESRGACMQIQRVSPSERAWMCSESESGDGRNIAVPLQQLFTISARDN